MRARVSRLVIVTGTALCSLPAAHAQTEIRLWPGKAPGSEQWSIAEATTRSPEGPAVMDSGTVQPSEPGAPSGQSRISSGVDVAAGAGVGFCA